LGACRLSGFRGARVVEWVRFLYISLQKWSLRAKKRQISIQTSPHVGRISNRLISHAENAELGLGDPRVGGLRAGGFRSAPGSENGLQELSRRHDLEALVAGNLQKVLVSADDGLAVGREGARYELIIIPVSRNLIR